MIVVAMVVDCVSIFVLTIFCVVVSVFVRGNRTEPAVNPITNMIAAIPTNESMIELFIFLDFCKLIL